MADNLSDVWFEVENLLNQNISVVPVRDRDEIYNGKLYQAKTPYREWKKYQLEIIDRAILFEQMQRYNTTAIAMVCGAISGNLEVIDFDVKYKPGIDAIVINTIKELYPEIFAKLRRHITRSGGTHLIYRIKDHEVPGSVHLAERAANAEELEVAPNAGKKRCYIETRGTGGLATAPPSLGYSIQYNIPITEITWEQRCSIIELCKSFNEYYPDEKPYLPPKSEQNYYDENPFEHYNRTVDAVELLTQFGWAYVRKHGNYIWFTRPGGRRGEVHAGFNTDKYTYRIWGTKADLDADKSYTPSTVLAHYRFNDDKSLTYAYLVQQGYGRIKPSMERTLAQRYAQRGQPLPANISAQAVEQYNQIIEQITADHPHGIFWQPDDEEPDKIIISRLGFNQVATKLGFRFYNNNIVQQVNQFIYRRELRFFFDCMREYIKEADPDIYEQIYNATQAFLERHGTFESTQLPILDQSLILCDTRTTCYKFYQNGYVQITVQAIELIGYETITEKLIWHEKIQNRDFVYQSCNDNNIKCDDDILCCNKGLYTRFIELACDLNNNLDHIKKVIGWLAHDYKDTTTGYIVTLTEKCADPKDGGGSGKNLFCELLAHTTTFTSTAAGQKRQMDGTTLLQSWKGERVFALSDVKKDFDFEMLKEPASGKAILKKLFKDENNLTVKEVPKFIVLTNFSFEISDGGLRRRIIAIEFTDFFTKCGGVDRHFGKYFPDDWSTDDWIDYDNFICSSVQLWITCGLKLTPIELTGTGWEKQFIYTYGITIFEFFKENWEHWKQASFVSNVDFNKSLDDFMIENNLNIHKYKPTGIKINKALDDWCHKHNWYCEKNELRRIDLRVERGRRFMEEAPF